MRRSKFKAPLPSLLGKNRPNAGERGHIKPTDLAKISTCQVSNHSKNLFQLNHLMHGLKLQSIYGTGS